MKRFVRALSPRGILGAAFALFVIYGFPGYMSNDSMVQLTEARSGHFSDGNPPLMAAEWWLLDRIISGPVLMLLLQGALMLGGLYVLFRRLVIDKTAAWIAGAIFVFPPVMVTMAVIWKDSQMAAYLVAGAAALIQPRLRTRLIGVALLVAACSLRHNAVAAVAPLIAVLFEWRQGMRWTKRLAIVGALAVVVGLAGFGITRFLAGKHVRLTPMYNDIVGVIAYTDHRTDADLREVLRGVPLAIDKYYQPQAELLVGMNHGWLVMNGPDPFFVPPKNEEQWDATVRAWKELVFDDPHAYFLFHTYQLSRLLHWPDDDLPGAVWNLFVEAQEQTAWVDHTATYSRAQLVLGFDLFYGLDRNTSLFHPWIYAVLALLLIPLCRTGLPFALFTSGLLYELSFFPVGVEPEYRYSHWMVLATAIGACVLFIQRRNRAA
ncbi:MAG: hypothetical protein ABJE66_05105 [Deltaproteobacteria bacterium]